MNSLLRMDTVGLDAVRYNALQQATMRASQWIQNHAIVLVLLCVLFGSATASLKVSNSTLFVLRIFNVGLPAYKQEAEARHRLWLTVLLENMPQIGISILYAESLSGFEPAVVASLASSMLSVTITVLSSLLSYPKEFYIYEMKATMAQYDKNLHKKLRSTRILLKKIAKGIVQTKDYLFMENVFGYDKRYFICNVVFGKSIRINEFKCQLIKNALMKNNKRENDSTVLNIDELTLKFVRHESVNDCYCSI